MSIWGKLAGAIAGYALGGPVGAGLGFLAGHLVIDRREKQTIFAIALIALSAKMAKADGVAQEQELAAFYDVMRVPQKHKKAVEKIYSLAAEDASGFEHYARQVSKIYKNDKIILEDVLDALFHIALIDGRLHDKEIIFLEEVAEIFGLSKEAWLRLKMLHVERELRDPYLVLGVERDMSLEKIRLAYTVLVRENHPDKLMAGGVPEEAIHLANQRLSRINGAWEQIKKERENER